MAIRAFRSNGRRTVTADALLLRGIREKAFRRLPAFRAWSYWGSPSEPPGVVLTSASGVHIRRNAEQMLGSITHLPQLAGARPADDAIHGHFCFHSVDEGG